MRLRLLAVMTFGILVVGGPALAGSGASQSTSAEGSSASTGSSNSSASISTGGGGSVGVVQGAVSGGGSASGSTSSGGSSSGGSSSGGSSGGGSSAAATAADEGPNAAQDGIVSQLDLPALGTVDDAIPASGVRSNVIIIGLAAIFAVGLFVLYRKLPRAGATA
jgi:hypothetical protein